MPFREPVAPSGKRVVLRLPLSELFSIRKDCFTPRSFRKGLCLCKDPTVNTLFLSALPSTSSAYRQQIKGSQNKNAIRKLKSLLEKIILFTRSSGGNRNLPKTQSRN
jgi:hypothetical protein